MDGAKDSNSAEKLTVSKRSSSAVHHKPRFLVIGGGRRGSAYASACSERDWQPPLLRLQSQSGRHGSRLAGNMFGRMGNSHGKIRLSTLQRFLDYERKRRGAEAAGEKVYAGIDGIIVRTQDHTHKEILQAFVPLKLHVLCEKPIAASLQDCRDIYVGLGGANSPEMTFSTGHVLRYSPHNMLLRKLLLENRAIGEVISVEHTEPVGWFHFSHSYVRGNWRKDSVAAPSFLCKSCHDIDFLLWLLCYRTGPTSTNQPTCPA